MGSFRRGIRNFRSQDVEIESRPSFGEKRTLEKIETKSLISLQIPFLGPSGDGRNFASDFWKILGTRFSQVFGIICISGGHENLLIGF